MSLPVDNKPDPNLKPLTDSMVLVVTSPSFKYGESIPDKFTGDGENVNPAISVENVPANAKSLTLIVENKETADKGLVHWILWNISPSATIAENSKPGVEGTNDFGNQRYDGPRKTDRSQSYHFTIYALDIALNLKPGATKDAVLSAIDNHKLAASELVGTYSPDPR